MENQFMKIWVDADACPRDAKDILFRTAKRREIETILVANNQMNVPKSPWIRVDVVEKGFDVADKYIADKVNAEDVVITADIPLAAAIVEKGALGIGPRGEIYDTENIQDRLATRNLLAHLRDTTDMMGGGPPPYKPKDKSKFASVLDRQLTRLLSEQ